MKKFYFLLTLTLLLFSCSKSAKESSDYASDAEAVTDASSDKTANKTVAEESTFTESEVIATDQKIIKTGNLKFQSSDLNQTASKIYVALKKCNGYIQLDSEAKEYNVITRTIVIRVPNQNFEKLVSEVTEGVAFFDEKQITSEDVSEEFIDLQARLKSKKELESRYLELLKRANKISEILEIETQINTIREEIEAKEGQLNYLKSRISMSTLNITFYKPNHETGISVSYGTKILDAIKGSVSWMPDFFIGLIYFWPLFAIGAGVYYFIRKKKNKLK